MKSWVNILVCVALSAGIWLIHNLSREYSGLVSVPVLAESNIPGRSSTASSEVMISARIQSTGYKIASLSRSRQRPQTVEIDAEDLVSAGGDFYSITPGALYKYASDIFGEQVSLEAFVADEVRFKFAPESCRKVPVRPVVDLTYKPQYMALSAMGIEPDSVLVYAEPSRLESVDEVLTRPITLRDLRASVHGMAKIDAPAGTRLSETEVAYSQEVTRYVEFRREADIEVWNLPRNTRISVLPSAANVTYRCVFPMTYDPSELVTLYVDYRDFAQSLDGSCLVRVDGLPDDVISCELDPRVCACVEVVQ